MDDIIAFDNLKTKVLKYILYKKRTEQEVRRKFAEVPENLLENVIEELKQNGYINDNSYIQRAVNEFMSLKTLSLKEISYKLYEKGIERDIIEKYIDENYDELIEYEKKCAKKIFIKKSNTMEKIDIITLLKKKGYREESIKYGAEE